MDSGVAELVALGFDPEKSEIALKQSNGNVQKASQILLLMEDPKKPKPAPLKLADPPAKGILRKTVRNNRKKNVRFDLPYVATVGTPPEHSAEAASKMGSGAGASGASNATDEDTRKPKVFLHHEAVPSKKVNKNSQYLGLELFQYYSTLCSRKGIQPWDKLLRQIKKASNEGERLRMMDLKALSFDRVHAEVIGEIIMNNTSLIHLNLEYAQLTDEVLKILLESLLFHNKLQWLNCAHNRNLKFDSFRYFGDYLTKNIQLRFLDVSGIPIDKKSAEILASGLSSPKCCLNILRMMDCGLKPGTFEFVSTFDILARGILKSRITDLNLRNNGLDSSSAKTLQAIIGRLPSLERLDVRNNDIKQGIVFIAAALEFTPSLQELLLWENGIDDKGLIALAGGLKRNKSLKVLDISFNPVGVTDALTVFKEALVTHQGISHLSMAATRMNAEGIVTIAEILPECKNLRKLDVTQNDAGFAGMLALNLAMKMNATLIKLDVQIDGNDPEQQRLFADILSRCEHNKREMEDRGEILAEVPSSSMLVTGSELVVPSPVPFVEQAPFPLPMQSEESKKKFDAELRKELQAARGCAASLQGILTKNEHNADIQKKGDDLADSCRAHNEKFVSLIPMLHSDSLLAELLAANDMLLKSVDGFLAWSTHQKHAGGPPAVVVDKVDKVAPIKQTDSPLTVRHTTSSPADDMGQSILADIQEAIEMSEKPDPELSAFEAKRKQEEVIEAQIPPLTEEDIEELATEYQNHRDHEGKDPSTLEEKIGVLLKNVFELPSFGEEGNLALHSEVEENIKKEAISVFEDESAVLEVIVEDREGCVFVKTRSEENAKKLHQHFDALPLRGKTLSAEMMSELEFFHRFPVVTPM